ncbi:type I-E CRISPR-associated protein Cse2/CasB [Allonocardiopsis opalescens]|uniref:CRISPR-associated protein Cse2 family n=1 Tax=Allonocardiopsis opalescens TaxID=1144618 RepID=A0A2T0QDC5_9ACTN|nr:type I-E CRISPR-associated protein Cse2/CasB [Allonocardiopsis opalescens]PRY01892.1 CRISPR-associated protein Cse2 family [Allonocardiopsis opalescens]
MTSADGPESVESSAARLTAWLAALVHNRQYGDLAQLRRVTAASKPSYQAGWFAPGRDRRETYEQVAFLFAVYHRGMARPLQGHGSFGAAARRIGHPRSRGPEDPGATRLIDRIVASRRIPWRHLQHGIARLRTCERPPPSWTALVVDLDRWNDRKARVAYNWAVDFHEPPSLSRPNRQKGEST